MKTKTKKAIIEKISKDTGIHSNDVRLIIQSFFDNIINFLAKGFRIEFRGFGILEKVIRKKKVGRNPKMPDVSIEIPERKGVKFTPGKTMKDLIEND